MPSLRNMCHPLLTRLTATLCCVLNRVPTHQHRFGYATVGYGAHGPGFVLALLAQSTMQGLCLLVADKSLGLGVFDAAVARVATTLKMEL